MSSGWQPCVSSTPPQVWLRLLSAAPPTSSQQCNPDLHPLRHPYFPYQNALFNQRWRPCVWHWKGCFLCSRWNGCSGSPFRDDRCYSVSYLPVKHFQREIHIQVHTLVHTYQKDSNPAEELGCQTCN